MKFDLKRFLLSPIVAVLAVCMVTYHLFRCKFDAERLREHLDQEVARAQNRYTFYK